MRNHKTQPKFPPITFKLILHCELHAAGLPELKLRLHWQLGIQVFRHALAHTGTDFVNVAVDHRERFTVMIPKYTCKCLVCWDTHAAIDTKYSYIKVILFGSKMFTWRGWQPWWLLCFIWDILINHEFWYQFHLNRLKNIEVVGVWIFANGLTWKQPYCRLSDITQPN